jgi:hypothetical protein
MIIVLRAIYNKGIRVRINHSGNAIKNPPPTRIHPQTQTQTLPRPD